MMPLGTECCKVQITCGFVYTLTTHNGILKNCTVANIAIKAFLSVTIMVNN